MMTFFSSKKRKERNLLYFTLLNSAPGLNGPVPRLMKILFLFPEYATLIEVTRGMAFLNPDFRQRKKKKTKDDDDFFFQEKKRTQSSLLHYTE